MAKPTTPAPIIIASTFSIISSVFLACVKCGLPLYEFQEKEGLKIQTKKVGRDKKYRLILFWNKKAISILFHLKEVGLLFIHYL
jgi:hypothetical protein